MRQESGETCSFGQATLLAASSMVVNTIASSWGASERAIAAPSGVYTKREHKQSSEELKYVADERLREFELHAASTGSV